MQDSQKNKPQKLNLDKSKKFLDADEHFYALNHDILNPSALGKSTPHPANESLCQIEQPAGENYNNGNYYSNLTNEEYSWKYNTNGAHYMMRVNGDGKCEIVYANTEYECLQLSPEPRHEIKSFRAYLDVEKICANRHGKRLIWTNGKHDIGCLDVEASIATNSFTTPFFQDKCSDPCDFVRLCVPKPCTCLHAEFIPLPESEISLTNHIVDKGFKFIFKHEYYDGRMSEWSDISSLFFQDVKGCFDSSEGFPRCLKFRVPVGNAMVDKIHIGFSKGGIDEDGNNLWYLTEVVEKYKKYNNSQEKWYERELAELSNYSEEDCSFDYIFCNDKQCQTIDPNEIIRVYNPQPRKAQGLITIKDALAFYNYEIGTCPIDKKEVDKFKISLACPEAAKECTVEYTTVKVFAIIHNTAHNRNQFVFTDEGDATNTANTAKFGGLNPSLDGGYEDPIGYDQYFRDKTRNFIAYIEGTDYWAEMVQYHAHPNFDNREKWGVVPDMGNVHTRNRWRRNARKHGEYFYQEATFKVPKGTRGFIRLASHHATDNAQDTSTFVLGVYKDIAQYRGNRSLNGGGFPFNTNRDLFDSTTEEIYFDTCDKDEVEILQAFIIHDNAVDNGFEKKAAAYYGYIKDESGRGVEGLVVVPYKDIELTYFQSTTDHNGFYHFYMEDGSLDEIDLHIKGEKDCTGFDTIKDVPVESESGSNTQKDIKISKDDNEEYQNNSQAVVKIKVEDCTGHGIGGIRVALSGSKYDVTDGFGIAKFNIRNYSNRARNIRAVVIDHGGCFTLGCDNECNPCMPTEIGSTPACYVGDVPPQILLPAVRLNKEAAIANKFGLKRGGRYPLGIVAEGVCGRISAVYETGYIEVPKLQKDGKENYCPLQYDGTGVVFPDWVDCVKIVRGQNVNPFELQWLVDKIEKTADGKLKLTIQSLNDYNAKYFFKTNTIYNWLKGDRVEFIKNGDGKVFSSAQHGILNFLTLSPSFDKEQTEDPKQEQPADYFNQLLIDDDGRLDDLTEGAVIELQRSKECTTEPAYFGICVTLDVVNGRLVNPKGMFTTFDTYLVSRKVGKFPTQFFEHHAPSDFWGDRLDDTGKAYFVNKYENERRYGRNITVASPTQINYFGDTVKTFDAPEHGDITAMYITDGKIILAIGEFDNFLAQTADELVRVGQDGIIRALPADALVSDAQPKLQGRFGCQYDDIGSIYFGDGYATFVDSNNSAYIHHENYQIANDASEGKVKSYFKKRCHEIIALNKKETDFLNHYRYSTGKNKQTGAIYLTIKRLRDSGINNQPEPYLQGNETLIYFPPTKDFLTFFSATPEAYGELQLHDAVGCAMITYLHGVPYLHPIKATKWNEFFGVAVDRFVGISVNKYPEKIKVALALELEDETMWFVTKVETDKPNFESEIPPKKFKKTERKWNAAFLGNSKSRAGLFGNEKPRGYFIAVTFCRDNTIAKQYKTVDNNLRTQYDELDMILVKFMASEQSGFTQNL